MRTTFCLACLLFCLGMVACAEAGTAPTATVTAESLTEVGPYVVGTSDIMFVDDARDSQEMMIKMWYPAKDNTGDAPPDLSGAPYPVVIYSHGAAYEIHNDRNSHSYLASHLASYGIVVVGVDHNDVDHAEAFTDRPLDILSVIDQLDYLAENDFAGVLAMEKLGVMGMSLGTATTMQMGGAHLDFDNASTWCAAHPNTYLCPPDPSVPERSRALMEEVGIVDENGLNYIPTDPRIRAVALMSPAFAPIYGERGLQSVNVPVLLLAGVHSEFYEDGEISFIYQHLGSPERYLISFKDGDHGYLLLPHLRTREQLMTAFWGYYLQNRQDYAQFLTEAYVNSVEGIVWGVYGVIAPTPMPTPAETTMLPLPITALPAVEPITPDNLDRLEELAAIDQGTVCKAVFSPDGQWLAASGDNITLWNLTDDWVPTILATRLPRVREITFDRGATFLAASTLGQVRVWDMASGDLLWQLLDDFEEEVGGVALSSDGTLVAAGTGCVFDRPGTAFVKVWDVASGTLLQDIPLPSFIKDVAFSPDGTLLAATSGETISLWQVSTGDLFIELHESPAHMLSVAFSPDGTRLLSVSYDENAELWEAVLWDVASGGQLYLFEEAAGSASFSTDGQLIVTGGDNHTFMFWDMATGTALGALDAGVEGNAIFSMAFNADNTLLATCGHDETLQLWGVPVSDQ